MAAPAGSSRYAVDSKITDVIRDIAPRFENRLFLSATPHNGHSNSFSALLELLDPQRFTRGVPVRGRGQLDAVERALVEEQECAQILQTIAACRGAIDGLMLEVFDGHIRMHMADPDQSPKSERSQAARELIDAARAYLK